MVSIPGLHPTNQNVNTWWSNRNLLADVYKWDTFSYVSVTSTATTEGYWMLHTGAQTYNTGDEWPTGGILKVPHDPIPCSGGWNLFGIYETPLDTADLTGIIPPVYGYFGGYVIVDSLFPGYGYFVRCNGPIVVPEATVRNENLFTNKFFKENWGKLLFTDAEGRSFSLYLVNGEADLSNYELPPVPPTGSFDIRFSSGKIAEDLNSAIKKIEMSGVTYPLTIRVVGMEIRLMDETGKDVNVNLKSGEEVVISDATIQKLMVSGELIPTVYALEQNYPNPFNPSTKIEFSIPEDVNNVTLTIYNTLGQRVAELVNSKLEAGKYSYVWNVPQSGIATGLYIYELRTDKFVSVKKMMLLK